MSHVSVEVQCAPEVCTAIPFLPHLKGYFTESNFSKVPIPARGTNMAAVKYQ